jgi:hypothetical protein
MREMLTGSVMCRHLAQVLGGPARCRRLGGVLLRGSQISYGGCQRRKADEYAANVWCRAQSSSKLAQLIAAPRAFGNAPNTARERLDRTRLPPSATADCGALAPQHTARRLSPTPRRRHAQDHWLSSTGCTPLLT